MIIFSLFLGIAIGYIISNYEIKLLLVNILDFSLISTSQKVFFKKNIFIHFLRYNSLGYWYLPY